MLESLYLLLLSLVRLKAGLPVHSEDFSVSALPKLTGKQKVPRYKTILVLGQEPPLTGSVTLDQYI